MADVIVTKNFASKAKRLRMSEAEHALIVATLSDTPTLGDLIQGSGGARKARFPRAGMGKSGGYRVVTFFGGGALPSICWMSTPRTRKRIWTLAR